MFATFRTLIPAFVDKPPFRAFPRLCLSRFPRLEIEVAKLGFNAAFSPIRYLCIHKARLDT